jgi:hypothetical protein
MTRDEQRFQGCNRHLMYFLAVRLLNFVVIFVANFVEIGLFSTKSGEVYDKVYDKVFTFKHQ